MADELPLEALADIFRHVPTSLPGLNHNMVDVSDLFPLTTVCRSWLDAALRLSSVWSTVSYNTSDEVCPRFRISRRAGHSLRVHIITKHRIDDTMFPFDTRRIRDLYIQTYRSGTTPLAEVFRFQYTLNLPALERCTIVGGNIETQIFPNSPRLRVLRLHTCCLPPAPGHFPALMHLHISECVPAALQPVVALLSGAPLLRVFKLVLPRDFTPAGPITLRTGQNVITVSHLRVFEAFFSLVNGKTMSATEFSERGEFARQFQMELLKCLAIPPRCTIRTGCFCLSDLLSILDPICASRKPTYIFVGQRWSSVGNIRRGTLNALNSFSLYTLDPGTHLDVGIKVANAGCSDVNQPVQDGVQKRLADALTSFPTVRRLWIELPWFRGPALSILPQLSDLEFLCIFGNPQFSQPLADMLNSLSISSTGEVSCPKLTTLAVDCHDGTGSRALETTSMQSVLGLARSRAAAGSPLTSLLLCLEERQDGQLVRVLHEYDGYGTLVCVDSRPGVRARVECRWAEGLGRSWAGPPLKEFEVARAGLAEPG
ncbi:hypothetical protein GY45DRAFT_1321645 [Cubamyces sp. BRFM 1775]|nr:hypothetical protein GY45DRAFT_1321645 [Cubamyces sp. BRFM 1775]